jgi:hypothetical protein
MDPLWINSGRTELVGTATIEADDELLTIAAHGLSDGDTVTVDTLTGGAAGALADGGVYLVRDVTTDSFALSLTLAGPVVEFAADGGADVYRFAPQYNATELRRLFSGLLWHGVDDRWGARSGLLPNTTSDPVSLPSSSTWAVNAIVAVVYTALGGANQGPYLAIENTSGSIDPADGTNPRIDAIDLQIQDDDGDGSGFRRAQAVYAAGTPASLPSAPSLTTNALRLATISVPAGGSPAPTVTVVAPFTVARGGVLPVRTSGERPTARLYDGMMLYDQATRAVEVREGGGWSNIRHQVIKERTDVSAAVSISSAVETTINTVNVDIPSYWSTYDIEAWWQFSAFDTSAGDTGIGTTITVRTKADGTNFGQSAQFEVVDTNLTDVSHWAGCSWVEGATITGTRSVAVHAIRGGNPTYEARSRVLIVHATRTS